MEDNNLKWSIELLNKKKKGEFTVEILSKRVLFTKCINTYNDNADVKEEMRWDMPNKQIGTIQVKRNISKLSKSERWSFALFLVINLLCILSFVVCFLDNAVNLENILGILLMLISSTLFLTNFSLNMHLLSRLKTRRFLSLYVETTKDENSLYLGSKCEGDEYYIEDTEENYRKLLEISEAISAIRK